MASKKERGNNKDHRVEILRKSMFDTQEQFVIKAGISKKTYATYLKKGTLNVDTLIKMSKTLDVSTDYLLGLSDHLHVDDEEISNQLGLPIESVNTLRKWKKIASKKDASPEFAPIVLKALSILIKDGWECLYEIFYFLQITPEPISIVRPHDLFKYNEKHPEEGPTEYIGTQFETLASEEDGEMLFCVGDRELYGIEHTFVNDIQMLRVEKKLQSLQDTLNARDRKKAKKEGQNNGKH